MPDKPVEYEFLVIADAKLGDLGRPVARMPRGHRWGRLEGPPSFQVVAANVTPPQRDYLMEKCRYDAAGARWLHVSDGSAVNPARDVIEPAVIPPGEVQRTVDLADSVAGRHVDDPGQFFCPEGMISADLGGYKRHWIDLLWAFREDPAVKNLLAIISTPESCWGSVHPGFTGIDRKLLKQIVAQNSCTDRDRDWLTRIFKIQVEGGDGR